MKRRLAFIIFLSMSALMQVAPASAWWSIFDKAATHTRISNAALQSATLIGLCPDLDTSKTPNYGSQVADGSNQESHNIAWNDTGNDNTLNGGFPKAWWDDGKPKNGVPDNALYYYKTFKFAKAYTYIGRMLHLLQDQLVPVHAANIRHGGFVKHQDNLEKAAYLPGGFNYDLTGPIGTDSRPYSYYQSAQNDTRARLASWFLPNSSNYYWYPSTNAVAGQDATVFGVNNPDYLGHYGGSGASDIYSTNTDNQDIVRTQLTKSVGYTEGALIAASKLLPPLVREPLKIDPPTLAEGTTTTITFRIIENRSPNVKISIMVEDTDAFIRDVSINSGYEGSAL
ncbi:MAG TPA: hypothetical protein PLL10_02310, partial [Elusimicrobiales bacterium]|nr:hypothetical protein [Elusimicrobiales bacterium]